MKIFKCSFEPTDKLRIRRDEDSVAVAVAVAGGAFNVVFLAPRDARRLAVELVREADKIDGGKS